MGIGVWAGFRARGSGRRDGDSRDVGLLVSLRAFRVSGSILSLGGLEAWRLTVSPKP